MNVKGLMKKELKAYFNSPMAYLVVLFFVLCLNIFFFFFGQFFAHDNANMRGYFQIVPVLFILILPAISMRSWAEERKLRTDELLFTLPLSEFEIVMGKFLSGVFLLVLMILLTLPVPIMLNMFGNFERGQIIGEYMGTFLLGMAGLSVGQFISSRTSNQISAYIFSVIILIFITFIGDITMIINVPPVVGNIFSYLSLSTHFESFEKGIFDTRDFAYFAIIISLFIYLNIKVIKLKK
ncbi:MAG: ABC transporter permease [Spirochaetia bacterium]|nr:ABC transporter permease [Spirochaetia bacterium]